MKIVASMEGTLADADKITVSFEGEEVGTQEMFTVAGTQLIIEENIVALADEGVVLTTVIEAVNADQETDVRITLLTSVDAMCSLLETTPAI